MESVDYLTQEVTRLIGEVKGKRVLELGLARDCLSSRFAAQGASPILVEESQAKLFELRSSEAFNEFKFEVRQSKLADLAFCPAESVDTAFSIIALAGTNDIARVFRQLQRVLKAQGTFIFGLVHPLAFMQFQQSNAIDPPRYRSTKPISSTEMNWNFPVPLPQLIHPMPFGETFSLLKRSGFGIDQLLEIPAEDTGNSSSDPMVLLIRARK
ncbi:MAG: methyltransferase domain-containing protein [Actinomycetota bacterium]|nr:MAG: methyltransferase domain-containing protein [Actinomycetota bacterium]